MKPFLRFVFAVASLLGVLVASHPARAHGAAVSRFVVSIGERELAVRANLHLESVLELVEGSHDLAHTGEAPAALERHRERILSYLREHLEFRSGGSLCTPREPEGYGIAEAMLYLRVDLAYDCPKPTTGLSVTSTLFAETDEPHYIEGEFHAGGVRRVYPLTKVRSSVSIDPSTFHDKPYRGQYIPVLGRRVEAARAPVGSTPAQGDAALEKHEHAPSALPVGRSDHGHASNRHGAEPARFITHAGWYGALLALVILVWHVERTLRSARSERRAREQREGRRDESTATPATRDDSNQAVSS